MASENTNGNLPDVREYLTEWFEDIELLRQNRLLNESEFLTFVRDRGIAVYGVVTGEPSDLLRRGWLASDEGVGTRARFHPFRLYPLHKILELFQPGIAPAVFIEPDAALKVMERAVARLPSERVDTHSSRWNRIVDLAILLEPVYWPPIKGSFSVNAGIEEKDYDAVLRQYAEKVLRLVATLDPTRWRQEHELLRIDAALMDKNSELYLMLRLASWHQRKDLGGRVGGALWIRHIAEVLRRGFEEVYGQKWPEEDQALGVWHSSGRIRAYGSERPLDDELSSKPYLAYNFGLFTGSAVHWYVEGDTEYWAVLELVPEPSKYGIELENLRGSISSGRGNSAFQLEESLKGDREHRRFSVISFDCDVQANVKAVRQQAKQAHIVGYIAAHSPDFEFRNFTVQELAEIAARLDERDGFAGDPVRTADWAGVTRAGDFESRYVAISDRKPSGLKGEEWGRALAAYADNHPHRPDDGTIRPLLVEIRAALHGRVSNYDYQVENFGFDPETFELIDLRKNRGS